MGQRSQLEQEEEGCFERRVEWMSKGHGWRVLATAEMWVVRGQQSGPDSVYNLTYMTKKVCDQVLTCTWCALLWRVSGSKEQALSVKCIQSANGFMGLKEEGEPSGKAISCRKQ